MMGNRTILVWGCALALVFMAAPLSLAVTPYDDILVQQAANHLKQENYDEAIAALTEAWAKGAHTPEKAFLLGQAYRLMLNYPKAKEYLDEALRLKRDFHPAQLMLADTYLALDKPKDARPILQELEASGFEAGQTAFLLGMVATKEGKYSEALDYFRKAETDPKVAQEAKFQASLALAALNRLKEAKKALEESIAVNPQTQTADFAQRYMGLLAKRAEELRPFHVTVSAGFDYDSNVSVSSSQAGADTRVSGKGDMVYSQALLSEYNIFPAGPFSVLAQYSYYQNFHPRVQGYDIMNHFMGITPTYSFKSGKLWVPINYTYQDLQSDKYYTGFQITPTYLHLVTENWGFEVGGRFNRKYFWTPVYYSEDNRSAKNYGGNMGMYYFFKKQKGFAQARFSYEHDGASGNNWDSSTYRLLLSLLYPATDKLKASVFLDVFLQPYDHTFYNGATYGNIAGAPLVVQPKRYDQVLMTGLQINYEILKGVDFNVHYYFIRDNSNISIYDYVRHIVGCQIGYRY